MTGAADQKKGLRIVVICSPDFSDIYFANQLMKRTNVVGVFVEQQSKKKGAGQKMLNLAKLLNPARLAGKIRHVKALRKFYEKSREIDLEQFGDEALRLFPPENCQVVYTEGARAINQPDYVDAIKTLQPDIIALCGCSIVGKKIISIPPAGVLNLHGGLPQKYRGVWTTMWAFYNGEPEYVGATVHYVDPGIDTGRIIYQGRPDLSANDNPESAYVKVVKLGIEMILQAILDIENCVVRDFPLETVGDIYLSRMVTPDILKGAWGRAGSGLVGSYLADREELDKKVKELLRGEFLISSSI